MRVIAGSAKGRKLLAPKGSGTRPALSQVKEALFNILGPIDDRTVLDLFAGSGSIGIEALSRGALHAIFVENTRSALVTIQKNLENCRFTEQAEIVPLPVNRVLRHLVAKKCLFDLIFVDPPYDENLLMPTLRGLEKVLADNGIVIVEHSPREAVQDTDSLKITDSRTYGQTLITFLEALNSPSAE